MTRNTIFLALFLAAFLFPSVGSVSNAGAYDPNDCSNPTNAVMQHCLNAQPTATNAGAYDPNDCSNPTNAVMQHCLNAQPTATNAGAYDPNDCSNPTNAVMQHCQEQSGSSSQESNNGCAANEKLYGTGDAAYCVPK
jgi:hypothetical protein